MLYVVETSGPDSPKLYVITCILTMDDDVSLAAGACILLLLLLEKKHIKIVNFPQA